MICVLFGVASAADAAFTALHTHRVDRAYPAGGLVADGSGNLFGTMTLGGEFGRGAVYTMRTDGTGFRILHSFQDGKPFNEVTYPNPSLVLDRGGHLYGTRGGFSVGPLLGSIFSLNVDGTGFTVLHEFAGGAADGAHPAASLTLDRAGFLYGTTTGGGAAGLGTVFRIRTDGTGFVLLHSMSGGPSEGQTPHGALVLDRTRNLYGTTMGGGQADAGTIFTLRTNGSGFRVLHHFLGEPADGKYPMGNLLLDGSDLYGTTMEGGRSTYGTVFRMKTDGGSYGVLHSFDGEPSDGRYPVAGLVLDNSGALCGTAQNGGVYWGVVFSLRTDGTGFKLLHEFAGEREGRYPSSELLLDGEGNFYGTTALGGRSRIGTVYRLRPDGSEYTVVYEFLVFDGGRPAGPLITDGKGYLYGTTMLGGASLSGTVFVLKDNGTGYRVLHDFEGGPLGSQPSSLVMDSAGTLYGVTTYGGDQALGTVFALETEGRFSVLHSFSGAPSDGGRPFASLILDGEGNLYGTTERGGSADLGAVFVIKTDGTGFRLLHSFTGSVGAFPQSPLLLGADGTLYGTVYDKLFTMKTDGTAFRELLEIWGSPMSAVVLDTAGNLYGTTSAGSAGFGTVYTLRSDGTGFRILRRFEAGYWSDDGIPLGAPILDRQGNLYGTTISGGSSGHGTVFKMRTDGTRFSLLHTFTGGADGGNPTAALLLDDAGNLYGSAGQGGAYLDGVEFRLAASPGDADGDGSIDVSDVLYAINHLFAGGPPPKAGGDANGDGIADVADVLYLINFLFAGGPAPTN